MRTFRKCLIVILLVSLLCPLSLANAETTGGTFRWGFAPPDNLNPFVAVNEASVILQRLNYESLVDYDQSFNYAPYLAESWEKTDDGLTWTFHLTDKSKWHDGTPLTSKDVKFTIDYVKQNKLGQFYSYVSSIKSVEAPDAKTVVMTLEKPLSIMLYNLRNLSILPEHIWSKMGKDQALSFKNDPVVGSGPFKFMEWKKGEYVKMETVKDYWKGRAKIDTLILKEISNDEAGVSALKAGELDGIRTVPPNLVPSLEKEKGISVVAHESFWFNELIINGNLKGAMGNPLLQDKAVREAIAHAIDKQKLVDLIFFGHAKPGMSIISSANEKWVNNQLNQFDFNLDKSKKILEDAGYLDSDGDGIREKNGKKLQFRFNVMNETAQFRAAQQISDWLKQIGISTSPVQTEDLGSLIYRDNDKNQVVDHDFDLMLWSWSGDPDPSFNLMTMLTEQIGNWQDAGYSNKDYDQLYVEQGHSLDDMKRKEIVDKMQSIVYSDLPYVVLYYPQRIQAYRSDKWEGLVPMVDGFISKLNIQTVLKVQQKAPEEQASVQANASVQSNTTNGAQAQQPDTTQSSSNSKVIWIVIGLIAVVVLYAIIRRRKQDVD